MEWIAAIGGLAFMLASLLVGGRLLLLSWRTRGFPEFVLGLGLFAMGGVGTPIIAAAKTGAEYGLDDGLRVVLYAVAQAIMVAGTGLLSVFTWKVFCPQHTRGPVLGILLPVLGLAAWAVIPLTSTFGDAIALRGIGPHAINAANFAVYLWAAIESLTYSRALAKRVALDLADPIVADRVRLWGIAILVAGFLVGVTGALAWMGIEIVSSALGAAFVGHFGLIASIALYLAFLPPRAYVAWVERRTS